VYDNRFLSQKHDNFEMIEGFIDFCLSVSYRHEKVQRKKINKSHHYDHTISEAYGNGEICSCVSMKFDFFFASLLQTLYISDKIQRNHIANLRRYNSLRFSKINLTENFSGELTIYNFVFHLLSFR